MIWGYLYWAWVLLTIATVLFAPAEIYAIRSGKLPTFSRFMANIRASSFGPIWIFLWGQLVGGLLIHFSTWCMYDVK